MQRAIFLFEEFIYILFKDWIWMASEVENERNVNNSPQDQKQTAQPKKREGIV